MKQTSLHSKHVNLNAKMVDFAGWSMPISYTSLKEEIKSVREVAGVFDVSHMGEFLIEGEGAVDFVDYLLPCDLSVKVGKAVYSPLLNQQGKILDDLILYKLAENKVLICVNASNEEKDWKWIKSIHAMKNFNCDLQRVSDDFSLLALQGPKSESILEKIGFDVRNLDYYEVVQSDGSIIARTGYTGEDGFEIFCNHEKAKELWDNLMTQGVTPCGLGARDTLRLEVCYPLYGNELTESLTPLDCGLKWTLKSKNSYIGLEGIEGYEPQYRLIKLSLERGIPRKGYKVFNSVNECVGEITSGTMSPTINKGIGLALVEKSKILADHNYQIEIRGKMAQATYHKKAFYNGGHK